MKLETKEIEVKLGDKPCKVVMEELTWGKRNLALSKATNVDLNTSKATLNTIVFGEWRLVYTIRDMDFVGWKQANTDDKKLDFLRGLPRALGDALSTAEQNLNISISEKEGKKNTAGSKDGKDTS